MKKIWLGIRIGVTICAAAGWWGLLYPQLSLTPDTVCVRFGHGDVHEETSGEWEFDSSLYRELLCAGPGKITFRSRFLTDLSSLWEAIYHGDDPK